MKIRGLSPTAIAQLAVVRAPRFEGERHVFLCICDHYEPMWQRPPRHVQEERVERWVQGYPKMAAGLADCRGRPPQHTFFYPQDEYDPALVEPIAQLCRQGWGDIEVHLHHDRDTAEGLREKLLGFTAALHNEHGMLRRDAQGRFSYGFIHGNWALNNSRPDGRWCGVNDETSILLETGCYADFTMPSAPAGCQISTMNSVYYATPDATRASGHDRGQLARAGQSPPENALLMIQGPLALDWSKRKAGLLPGIENGDLTGHRPPTLARFQLWQNAGVTLAGRPEWRFIKLHTHGAQEANAAMFFDGPMRRFHEQLAAQVQLDTQLRLYYVTAHEMAELARLGSLTAPHATNQKKLSACCQQRPQAVNL